MTIQQFSISIAAATIQNLRTTSVTQTTIALAWDAYPGATAYEVRRNGTLVSTTANTTYSNSGHTAGTSYTYAVRPVVGGSGVASAQASIVVMTVGGSSAYPNLPSGLAVIGSNNGTVVGSTDAFGIPAFGPWVVDSGVSVADVIELISDGTNPAGSGQALRFEYDQSRATKCAWAFASFTPVRRLYVMLRIFFEPAPGGLIQNTKLFYVGAPTVTANNEFYNTRETSGRYRLIYQGSLGSIELHDSSEASPKGISLENALPNSTWLNIEHLFEAGTTPTSADGRARTWINGTLISDTVPTAWGSSFGEIEWYADANSVIGGTQTYYRVGELYIAGAA